MQPSKQGSPSDVDTSKGQPDPPCQQPGGEMQEGQLMCRAAEESGEGEHHDLDFLLKRNRLWRNRTVSVQPTFFKALSTGQSPDYLWIGCSDSRVPAELLCGLKPGQMFVHRNIANIIHHTDMSMLSVLEYAVGVLKVKHVILCGHYGCGGVAAALTPHTSNGILDNWLRFVKDVYADNRLAVDSMPTKREQLDMVVRLNVWSGVNNIAKCQVVQCAWAKGQPLSIHGLVYSLEDGLLHNVNNTHTPTNRLSKLDEIFDLLPEDQRPSAQSAATSVTEEDDSNTSNMPKALLAESGDFHFTVSNSGLWSRAAAPAGASPATAGSPQARTGQGQ